MIKEYSWVPVFDEDKDNYVPGQYQTKDIYQGVDCLPMFDTKEECELWCKSESPYAPVEPKKESFENKSLKWWMTLSMDQQVAIGFKYDEPTFNLTIRAIMFEYEQSLKNK